MYKALCCEPSTRVGQDLGQAGMYGKSDTRDSEKPDKLKAMHVYK